MATTRKATRKRSGGKARPKRRPSGRAGTRKAGEMLREGWSAALGALSAAEGEMQRQVRVLLRSRRINPREAKALLKKLGTRAESERRKAMKELQARLSALQERVKKERSVLARTLEHAVQSGLAALNVPSRQEVAELMRKVDELSRKIDAFRRQPAASGGKASRRGHRLLARS